MTSTLLGMDKHGTAFWLTLCPLDDISPAARTGEGCTSVSGDPPYLDATGDHEGGKEKFVEVPLDPTDIIPRVVVSPFPCRGFE
jgi:hypothetical protein